MSRVFSNAVLDDKKLKISRHGQKVLATSFAIDRALITLTNSIGIAAGRPSPSHPKNEQEQGEEIAAQTLTGSSNVVIRTAQTM